MAFVRDTFQSRSIVIPAPPQNIKHYRGKTKDIFNNLNTKNPKLIELLKLLQTHLIINEFWLQGYKWIEKKIFH